MLRRIVAGEIVLLALATTFPVFAADSAASYACDDGTHLLARFHGPQSGMGTATLVFPDQARLIISQAMSADGGRYAAGRVEFWIKGKQATFTQGDHTTTCTTS